MKITSLLIIILFIAISCKNELPVSEKPNIVLIQLDDLGYDDLGMHGNKYIETPNIDALGTQSLQFDQFYVSALCAPSRAALLTGRHFQRTGVSGVHSGRDYVNLKETTMAEVFQKNGYKTGMWGKWHSGKTNGYFPWDRGFDEAYYSCLYNYFNNEGLLNGEHIKTEGYVTDKITDMAIQFIEENKNEPFLAYISHLAPHNPWRAPEEYTAKYRAKGLSEPMSLLYGMIDNIDVNIGRVLNTLDSLDLSDNTVVIFLSDNGPWDRSYRFGLNKEEWELRNPSGMRGKKGKNWENGIRSPLFIRWNGKIQPKSINNLVKVEDIFPSLLNIAGIPLPDSLKLDGRNITSLFKNDSLSEKAVYIAHPTPVGDKSFFNKIDRRGYAVPFTKEYCSTFVFENQRLAIRKGDYKLILNEYNNVQKLFNIALDPREKENIATNEKHLANQLNKELFDIYQDVTSSPYSFAMPEFQIGYKNRSFSQIYACAPAVVSKDLMNADHYLANWQKVGDSASYKINVHNSGFYKVFLIHKIENYNNLSFKVSADQNNSTASRLTDSKSRDFGVLLENESAYWENFDLKETFKKDIIKSDLGQIMLEKGNGYLTVKLIDKELGHVGKVKDQLIAIQLLQIP